MSTSMICSTITNEIDTSAPYYLQYPTYNCAVIGDWNTMVSPVNEGALYALSLTYVIPVLSSHTCMPVCPYVDNIGTTEPGNTNIPEMCGFHTEVEFQNDPSEIINDEFEDVVEMSPQTHIPECVTNETVENQRATDPIEFYFSLPKELFPTARMFAYDPNQLIDEFCKMADAVENIHWILDLEFGIPRVAVTRAIAIYDIIYNSVHCKNAPNAIHPGFEKCTPNFKRVALHYYDYIVSAWYKGYTIMNQDKSLKNFQTWILLPMQVYGMAWR